MISTIWAASFTSRTVFCWAAETVIQFSLFIMRNVHSRTPISIYDTRRHRECFTMKDCTFLQARLYSIKACSWVTTHRNGRQPLELDRRPASRQLCQDSVMILSSCQEKRWLPPSQGPCIRHREVQPTPLAGRFTPQSISRESELCSAEPARARGNRPLASRIATPTTTGTRTYATED